jgi:hypothetical protein
MPLARTTGAAHVDAEMGEIGTQALHAQPQPADEAGMSRQFSPRVFARRARR